MNNENSIFNLIYNNRVTVYDALTKTLQRSPNFQVINEEQAVYTVNVIIGKSLFNTGDEISIKLDEIDENKTKISFNFDIRKGIVDNIRVKYGDTIQKLLDKMKAILPPPVMEEAPKPNNLVQVGELANQMNASYPVHKEITSLTDVIEEEKVSNEPLVNNEPKPIDYESIKENESSKHQGNDPLKDLMSNL